MKTVPPSDPAPGSALALQGFGTTVLLTEAKATSSLLLKQGAENGQDLF